MARVSGRDNIFKSTTTKTFENEEKLPNLPVPNLAHTLELYLESVRAVTTHDEYRATETIVRKFENGIGIKLQKMLVERANTSKNWLEEWWETVAYLYQRLPLIPYSNMTASQPNTVFWPIKFASRIKRTALILYSHMEFWQLLRKQQLKPDVNKGNPWSMYQYKRILNVCRIPGEVIDTLVANFKTEEEGPPAPTNVVVLYKGYIFTFDLIIDGLLLTPVEIEAQLSYIEKLCDERAESGPGVGSLTTTDRTKWAQNRQYLKSLSAKNKSILDIIENSLMAISLDNSEPITQLEVLQSAMLNNCVDRWADKSLTQISYINGNIAASADHTPFDGLAIGTEAQFIFMSLYECRGVYKGPSLNVKLSVPSSLDFDIDDKIVLEISDAKKSYYETCDDIEVYHGVYTEYGRALTAKHQLHPEAYIQVALQAAYYRTHGKPAPTYCTATTRKFYHGRTETCRSCFPENVEFAKAFAERTATDKELYHMLQKATQKFQSLMSICCNGLGCDRHLLGLYLLAYTNGMEIPEIFTDSSFTKSGGNGNYILSTSCGGYWYCCGLVPPMIKDGYSFFYGIERNQYTFTVSSFNSCAETSAHLLYDNMCSTLSDLRRLLSLSSNL